MLGVKRSGAAVYFCKVTAISVFTEALGLLNGIGRGSVALAACVAITSCASQQRITLAQPAPVVASTDIIVQILDLRDTRQRAFHAEGQPHCFRSYGDEFIAPSKVAYFREVLESRSAPHARANLTLSRFETVEFCDAAAAYQRKHAIDLLTKNRDCMGCPFLTRRRYAV